MLTYPNQKTVIINKQIADKHTALSLKAIQTASLQLSGEGFKLWIYLAKNQNNYILALSCQDSLNWGIGSKSSYYRAIKELKEKGYLQKQGSNYLFYELPILNIEIINK